MTTEYVKVLPIVHLNGTSKQELVDQRIRFAGSIQDALSMLNKMSPNGRDYYPEPGRLEKAVAQHERRVTILKMLYGEIESEVLDLEADG